MANVDAPIEIEENGTRRPLTLADLLTGAASTADLEAEAQRATAAEAANAQGIAAAMQALAGERARAQAAEAIAATAADLATEVQRATAAEAANGSAIAALVTLKNDRGPIAANTNYVAGDLVTYRGRKVLITGAVTSGTGAVPFLSGSKYISLAGEGKILAYDYGARGDGATDSTAAIQAAIDYAFAMGGGTVELPAGVIVHSTTIIVKQNVWVDGQGMYGTYVRQINGANCGGFKAFTSTGSGSPNAAFVALRNMTIDGNSSNTAGTHGVDFTTNPATTAQSGTSLEQFDMHHVLENVRIRKFKGDGVHLVGRSAIQLKNVHSTQNDGYGFYSTFDTNFTHCEADGNGLTGFYLNNGSVRLAACKSYLAGSTPFTGSGFTGDPTAAGYEFGSNVNGVTLAGCEAQNCSGPGYRLNGCRGVNVHGVADSNNNNATANALMASRNTNPAANATATEYAGVELTNATNCIVSLICWQGKQGAQIGNQYNAIRVTGTSSSNHVTVTHYGGSGLTVGPAVTSDSVAWVNSTVNVNGVTVTQKLASMVDVAFGALADGQTINYDASTGKWRNTSSGATNFAGGIFGDGSDGTVTLDGTATVPWATLAAGVYTMNRDCFCTNVTVSAGVTLRRATTAGAGSYRVFATGTYTNNGTDTAAGNDGTATAGGASWGGAPWTTRSAGGAGGTSAAGTAGQGGGYAVGAGSAGGTGSSTAGGAGGSTQGASNTAVYRTPYPILTGFMAGVAVKGAGGGGGGGGDGTNRGGGGGSGGGLLVIFARTIVNNGTWTVKGGNGFTPTTGACGGGGAGGGGLIIGYSMQAWTQAGTTIVTAGTPGNGVGTGTAGAAAGAGQVFNAVLA